VTAVGGKVLFDPTERTFTSLCVEDSTTIIEQPIPTPQVYAIDGQVPTLVLPKFSAASEVCSNIENYRLFETADAITTEDVITADNVLHPAFK